MAEFVRVSNLVKNYGNLCAVDNLSFSVQEGEIFGLLGPNGAGKSTTINIITTLLEYDKGGVTVGGLDSIRDRNRVKGMIGVVPQDIALHPYLTARENVSFFASLYGLKGKNLKEAAERALAFVGLEDKAAMRMNRMSGGMKRRLNIACGIAHRPKLIVMDEPTVGVDAQSRDLILHSIQILRQEGATVIYTSHYMQEVEEICDRIAIVDRGALVACGTEKELVAMVTHCKTYEAEVRLPAGTDRAELCSRILLLPDLKEAQLTDREGRCFLQVEAGLEFDGFMQLLQLLQQEKVNVRGINTREPSLDTVFLTLTGRQIQS